MSKENQNVQSTEVVANEMQVNQSEPATMVCVVTCYGNIVGVYRSIDDAQQVQRGFILKNRPAECIVKPLN